MIGIFVLILLRVFGAEEHWQWYYQILLGTGIKMYSQPRYLYFFSARHLAYRNYSHHPHADYFSAVNQKKIQPIQMIEN